ncbi:MAG: CDC48 family AAA ATPase [Candidatus Tectomicrobia bacterium]|nr:CDC48 family AAA ATPase [Candidatus Tectomicrobia bacterium]
MAPEAEPQASLQLRVVEAHSKDVGRGIARLDPADMKELDVAVGDVVRITGKQQTVAKAMPAFAAERGQRLVQIDGLVRGNAKVGLDEKVLVEKTACQAAAKITLNPRTLLRSPLSERDHRYLVRLMEGLPVTRGDTVRANLFGARSYDFLVAETIPDGAVVVHPTTVLSIAHEKGARPSPAKTTYDDIGGLGREVQRIREMIELPLKHPQVFERLGIDAPKGVLLVGPPGCGKTLIARAVAHETEAHFLAVNGPEVIHKFYGESEAKLRKLFDEASKQAPSILFLDEIDAIAPKRETAIGEVEKRVVAQLLALMDGLRERGQVIVIGATNIPNALDPALRRPGRFDRELVIGVPDTTGRQRILEIHTRGMPLSEEVDLQEFAQLTLGFVGADLQALCREAAMVALRRLLPRVDFESQRIPYEELLDLRVGRDDFLAALREVEPSGLREVSLEVPNVSWDDVGGLAATKQWLQENIEWPLRHRRLFEEAHLRPPKGILIYGPPGCGKTLLAKAVATECQINFISVKGPELISKWVGEAERGVRELFRKARQAAPCILFFDEIDALAPVRGHGESAGVTERVVSQLLTELDGIESQKGVIVLATTNRIDMVDPALLRSGRFDLQLEVGPLDDEGRREILEVHTRRMPLSADVDLAALVLATSGWQGAQIEALCREAGMCAVREFLRGRNAADDGAGSLRISGRHFDEALRPWRRGASDRST